MGRMIPIINKDSTELKEWINGKIRDPVTQKRLVLIIVSIALLLDNMLYMVIVPIIPIYLREIKAFDIEYTKTDVKLPNGSILRNPYGEKDYIGEDEGLGFLFASKALVQIMVGPFSGTLIDRVGYEIPMIIGLIVMFGSTSIFALGESYAVLFFARSLQGVGSAFADTAGLAMIADRFTEEHERSKALGIALAFISFGSLVAPPFGGVLYEVAGKPVPFMILAIICLLDGFLVFTVIQPSKRRVADTGEKLEGTPIYKLFLDPYIACCSGALIMANVSLAFLEPTISRWMKDEMPGITESKIGMIWLPAFFPHVAGVYATVVLLRKYPQHPWLLAAIGLAMEGLSCFIVPFCGSFWMLALPLAVICFGIALIDTSLLPMLGYLVDTRHVSVYGSVYAIADISYSLAYAFGPIIAGEIMAHWGFFSLNLLICLSNVLYAPALSLLRTVYVYKPFDNEMQTLTNEEDENFYQSDFSKGGYGAMGDMDDQNMTQQEGYGYGDDNVGGFGVGVPDIQYHSDYPQPEYPLESKGRARGPRPGYDEYR